MPYSQEHKAKSRAKIIEAARILFNRHGFHEVTIDVIMKQAGLTRGGFYAHFKNKEELFGLAIQSFLHGRGARWRNEAGVDLSQLDPQMARHMIDGYLSAKHLADIDGQCPMIALPSDVARAGDDTQDAYQELLKAMIWLFERNLPEGENARPTALSLAAICVGGMVLARALPNSELAHEVRQAAHDTATAMTKW